MLTTAQFSIQHMIMTILPQAILLKLKTLIFPQKKYEQSVIRYVSKLLHEFHFGRQVELVQATTYTARKQTILERQ